MSIQELGICSERLSLGFSFSFEMKQLTLEKALMVKWAKGFDCSDVIGEDVVRLLNDAIVRRGVGFEFRLIKMKFNNFKTLFLGHQRCCTCRS